MTTLPAFALHRVDTVASATETLDELGDEAVVYAGGTELLLVMKLGFGTHAHLVDVKPIPELGRLEVVDGSLVIGATVSHRTIERSAVVREGWPALVEMERRVANVRVRAVGTLGGNLAFADPHSDPATFLLAADARVTLGLGDDRRSLPIGDFVLGPYQTALQPCELLVAIEVPPVPAGAAMAHQRFGFHERPAATIACLVRVAGGAVVETRIAVGSVGIVPVRVPAAEGLLGGADPTALPGDAVDAAGRAAAEAADPVADANGAADYKRDLVRVLVGRCLRETAARAAALTT